MPIAVYRKQNPAERIPVHRRSIPIIPVLFMILGALMTGSVAGPIAASWLVAQSFLHPSPPLLSPLSTAVSGSQPSRVMGQQIIAASPQEYDDPDFRNPGSWFPSAPTPSAVAPKVTHYNISIPKLKIQDAVVTIGGTDLGVSLIHYPGTAFPGELGAGAIFGHSVLRQFYNPTNYMTIFSTIMTLQNGDDMTVDFDGVKYAYRVVDKVVVKPTDVQILEQRYDGRFLKLITCFPEGTYLYRGVVIAELVHE